MALAVDSEMPSNVGQGTSGTGTGSPWTFSFTNAAGTVLYLLVGLGANSGQTCTLGAVSYGGVAMTSVVDTSVASGAGRVAVFRLLNPATGSNTVSIAFTRSGGTNFGIWGGCISFTGNHASTPEVQSSGGAGTGSSASASLSGVASGNVVIAVAGSGSSMSAQSKTLTWAKNVDDNTVSSNGRASRSVDTGSVTHSFTISASDSWGCSIVEVAAAAGAAATSSPFVSERRTPRRRALQRR